MQENTYGFMKAVATKNKDILTIENEIGKKRKER